MKRGTRSITAIRDKRRRYRQKKKAQIKEGWEERILEETNKRWKKRDESCKLAELDEALQNECEANLLDSRLKARNEYKQIEDRCRQEISAAQTDAYNELCEASSDVHNDSALLLPSVSVPESTAAGDFVSKLNLSGIDRVMVTTFLREEK